MNESYHIWMSHVTCEWVMSHCQRNARRSFAFDNYRQISIKCEWVTSHMHEASHIWMHACRPFACVHVDHLRSTIIDTLISYVPYEWVLSYVGMSHVIYDCMHVGHLRSTILNKSISHVTYEWVLCHIWMSHITFERVMSHIRVCT